MKRNTVWLIILSALLFTFSCSQPTAEQGETDQNGLYIVATTGMLGDAVKNIVGEKAQVEALMGPGVDPHLYKATQSDLTKLNKADIVFYNGLYLEGKMEGILEKLGQRKKTIAVGKHIDEEKLIRYGEEEVELSYDPHIWFDVALWSEAVQVIGDELIQFDPDHAAHYEQNTNEFVSALKELDQWVEEQIHSIPEKQRLLITSHDAFEYFGEAYDIEVEGLQGISTASDYGLQDVTRLVDKIIKQNVKAVFVETSVSDRSLKAVMKGCQEKGHEVTIGGTLYSDAMGEAGTPEGTYVGMVKSNVNAIVEALK